MSIKWHSVIGLEIHAQIISQSKLFSTSQFNFGAEANSQVSLFDAAMPGTLPTLNEYCIYQAIKAGISLNANINLYSRFDRKHYFYPDLPQGYQISQFYYPIAEKGYLNITLEDNSLKLIRINRIHLEQDAGKSVHDQLPESSIIDLNRCGVALIEIVTEPDITSSFEAGEFIRKLRSILRYIGSCDGDMEKGSLRCDANISLHRIGSPLGVKCEIKNLNSIKNVVKAIEFEIIRQKSILDSGNLIQQETRLFCDNTGETKLMRTKEQIQDYRYIPDPDLLPVIIKKELVDSIKSQLPESLDIKILRYTKEYLIKDHQARIIISDDIIIKYFEEAIKSSNPKAIANWLVGDLFFYIKKYNSSLENCKVKPLMLSKMVNLIEEGSISTKVAKKVLQNMLETGEEPDQIISKYQLVQLCDSNIVESIIENIVRENHDYVIAYKNGRTQLLDFFIGQVMKETSGKANPLIVSNILKSKLL